VPAGAMVLSSVLLCRSVCSRGVLLPCVGFLCAGVFPYLAGWSLLGAVPGSVRGGCRIGLCCPAQAACEPS